MRIDPTACAPTRTAPTSASVATAFAPAAARAPSPAPGATASWREKLGLGLGRVTVEGTQGTLHILVSPIYNMVLGMNPAALSLVIFIQRLWDALLDPCCGHLSDRLRARWGRRKLMTAAIVPVGVLFAALWWFPRGASEERLFWNLLLVSLAFFGALSLYAMPLGALTIEATDDYHGRTNLVAVTMIFGFAFNIVSQWLFPFIEWAGAGDTLSSLRWITGGCAALFIVAGLAPVLFCRDRGVSPGRRARPAPRLRDSLRAAARNPDFVRLLTARLAAQFGYSLVALLGLYLNTYYVFGGDVRRAAFAYGFLGSAFHVAAILSSAFVYPRIARRFGKKRALEAAMVLLLVDGGAKLLVYQPGHPWWQFIVLSANGAASAGLVLASVAMLGDLVDEDERRTGERREGFFYSLLSWVDKAGNALGTLLGGLVLVWIGFEARHGAQSAHTLALMKMAYVVAPSIGAVLALLCIRGYRLDQSRGLRS